MALLNFNEWEKTYLKFSQIVANPKKLEKALKSWNMDRRSKILDMCCGSGGYFYTFEKAGYQNIFGLDFSHNLLAHVKDPVTLIQADALSCPIKENSFDAVFINKALHHFHEYGPLMKEIKKMLKPGGYFCFIEPRSTWFRRLYHCVLQSPIIKFFPPLEKYREAALVTEGETYFKWLEVSQRFFRDLESKYGFTIESLKGDLLHYVVKCKNNVRRA